MAYLMSLTHCLLVHDLVYKEMGHYLTTSHIPENTHPRGKDHGTTGPKFNKTGTDQ